MTCTKKKKESRKTHKAAVGIGSNVGDRLANIRRSLHLASERVGPVISKSGVYESPPWGVTDQPRFLNACAVFETEMSPYDLLTEFKEVESVIGRIERGRWGPREIDLDLILYDGLDFSGSFLTVPHAGMHERAFVLIPLAEIAPDWLHPRIGSTVQELAESVRANGPADVANGPADVVRIVCL